MDVKTDIMKLEVHVKHVHTPVLHVLDLPRPVGHVPQPLTELPILTAPV